MSKNRLYYFYICDDCGEAIPQRLDTLQIMQNACCKKCTSKKLAKQMCKTRNPNYYKKSQKSREHNAVEKNSLFYGLYELGLSDLEIGEIVGLGSSGIANWRWKRNIPPNFEETDKVDAKGRFKPKNIKGSRDIYTHTRAGLIDWKYLIMQRDNFKCVMCGDTNDKEVHHNKEKFMDIMKKFLPNREIEKELTWNEKKRIAGQIVKYHYDNNVSGITVCGSCHRKIHSKGDAE